LWLFIIFVWRMGQHMETTSRLYLEATYEGPAE
jgi:hypothetical protein